MASVPKYLEFTFDWTHRWEDYDRIGKGLSTPRHYFITSFKNVSFRWYAYMYATNDTPEVGFFITYEDGPFDKISGVECKIGVVKNDQSLKGIRSAANLEYRRKYMGVSTTSSGAWGWKAFEDKNSTDVRTKYGLKESDSLTYQITMKMPMETFAYCIPSPAPAPCSPWAMKLFESIKDNEGDSSHPDKKVAGRDGIVFNCHKAIVAAQSKALETIFQHPPSDEGFGEAANEDEQSVPNPKKRKASAMDEQTTAIGDGVYDFPNLSAASLKSVLEYLYTGKVTTASLTVTEWIEIGDAGEQYDLKPLKEFSAAELWKRVVIEEATSAFEIARFADLHDEMQYLKHRALDVIAENYQRLGVKPKELVDRFGGTRGEELRDELMEYMGRRLRPIFKE